jgi:hypothetical protein
MDSAGKIRFEVIENENSLNRGQIHKGKGNQLDIPPDRDENMNRKNGTGMKIKFSRPVKRRASLYRIPESMISVILTSMNLEQGQPEIIRDVPGLRYPLKIVVSIAGDTATAISNYPMKKGRKT